MKIVLIPNPVLEDGRPRPYVPLGALALATVLRKDGFDAEILDINAICEDPSYRGMTEAIVAAKPDVVGFSTWCNYYLDLVKTAERIRQGLPDVKILFGGVQATHTDRETVQAFPQVDVVARGECDHTISEIISSIHDPDKLRRVRGVTFMSRGTPGRTPDQGPVMDLDALPLPDYSLLRSMKEIDRVGIDVGRGCPFRCGYCVSNSMGEGKFRQRSVENIVKIVKGLLDDYGKTYFRFEHDMLTLKRKWLLDLCDSLEKENLGISWECFSRIDTIDEEMMERMAAAGCNDIYFGIETGSPRMQKLLNKRLRLDRAPSVIRKVCDFGMIAASGFILGFPQEKMSDIAQTMRLMLELYFSSQAGLSDVFIWLLVAFPGSPLFERYGRQLALDEHVSNFAASPATLVDMEFVKNHAEVFSNFYHFVPEHTPREIFVRVVHLMKNMLCLRYTAFALLKDPEFGYPQSLLDRITELRLPEGNIFSHIGSLESLSQVSGFIAEVINGLGFEDHYIHDLIKYDMTFNSLQLDEAPAGSKLTCSFSHDVMAFIKGIRANGFRELPTKAPLKESAAVFRKLSDDEVDCIELPAIFKISPSNLRFGTC
jgi:radical SAM superfamily enzyme YgiQ (UPF0313 family)